MSDNLPQDYTLAPTIGNLDAKRLYQAINRSINNAYYDPNSFTPTAPGIETVVVSSLGGAVTELSKMDVNYNKPVTLRGVYVKDGKHYSSTPISGTVNYDNEQPAFALILLAPVDDILVPRNHY